MFGVEETTNLNKPLWFARPKFFEVRVGQSGTRTRRMILLEPQQPLVKLHITEKLVCARMTKSRSHVLRHRHGSFQQKYARALTRVVVVPVQHDELVVRDASLQPQIDEVDRKIKELEAREQEWRANVLWWSTLVCDQVRDAAERDRLLDEREDELNVREAAVRAMRRRVPVPIRDGDRKSRGTEAPERETESSSETESVSETESESETESVSESESVNFLDPPKNRFVRHAHNTVRAEESQGHASHVKRRWSAAENDLVIFAVDNALSTTRLCTLLPGRTRAAIVARRKAVALRG